MSSIAVAADRLKEILGLETEPVAVFLLPPGAASPAFDGFARVAGHRYCQLLMRARHGESLRLEPSELACPPPRPPSDSSRYRRASPPGRAWSGSASWPSLPRDKRCSRG